MSKTTGQQGYNEHLLGRRKKTAKPTPKGSKKMTVQKTAKVTAATSDDAKPADKSGNPRSPKRLGGPAPDEGFYAPWITDPDPPEEPMTEAESRRAAQNVARLMGIFSPEQVDRSHDGPIKKSKPD